MRVRTWLASLAGVGVGYVLGAAAGRERFEQIKSQAQRIVSDPEVRQKVADLPNQVKENLPKAQSAVADKVKGVQDKVEDAKSDTPTSTFDSPAAFDSPSTFDTPSSVDSPTTFDGPSTLDTPSTLTEPPSTTTSSFDEPTSFDTATTVDSTFDAPATVDPTFDTPRTTSEDRI